jgi:hypothetical protein
VSIFLCLSASLFLGKLSLSLSLFPSLQKFPNYIKRKTTLLHTMKKRGISMPTRLLLAQLQNFSSYPFLSSPYLIHHPLPENNQRPRRAPRRREGYLLPQNARKARKARNARREHTLSLTRGNLGAKGILDGSFLRLLWPHLTSALPYPFLSCDLPVPMIFPFR